MSDNTAPTTITFQVDTAPPPAPVEPPKLDAPPETPPPPPVEPPTLGSPTIADSVKATLDTLDPPKKESKSSFVVALALACGIGASLLFWNDIAGFVGKVVNHTQTQVEKVEPKKEPIKKAPQNVQEDDEEFIKLPPSLETKRLPAGILEDREYYIRFRDEDQKVIVRTGGSRSWRLNNPCSILYGKFAISAGSIGNSEKYAVWTKYQKGREACYDLLFKSDKGYKELSVENALKRFAPAKEGFKTEKYLKAAKDAKFVLTHTMSNLSEERRNKLIDVLMKVEDFDPNGKVYEYENLKDFNRRGF